MGCLGVKNYDPGTAVTKGTAASALAAFDTTNLRITFTAPASGKVLVKLRTIIHGATTFSQIMLGVLDSATVMGRATPAYTINGTALATTMVVAECAFVVDGLNAGQSYTWDAAWGIETFVASSLIKYGGPNNATANDAFGPMTFEVWAA
jgi:hypothetical protein